MSTLKRLGIRLVFPAKVEISDLAIRVAIALAMFSPVRALAADWDEPVTTMFESLESGLVSIAAPIIGIGVILYGIWAMVTGRIDIMRLAQLVGAGALVIFGPTLLRTLLSAA